MNKASSDALLELVLAAAPTPERPMPLLEGLPRHLPPEPPRFNLPPDHEARATFLASIAEDPAFQRIVQSEDPNGAFVACSDGTAWRLSSSSIPDAVTDSAARRTSFTGGDPSDLDVLAAAAVKELDRFRRLLMGEKVEVLGVAALTGLRLPADAKVSTPWGHLRSPSDLERGASLFGESAGQVSAVLESPVEVAYRVISDGDDDASFFDRGREANLEQAIQRLALSALLAVEREYVVVEYLWLTSILPASNSYGYMGRTPRGLPRRVSTPELTPEEQTSLAAMAAVVAAQYHASLETAVKRLFSAIRERVDPEDALIDAAIVVESLFGQGDNTEVAFRVTTAMTKLLEPDASKRLALRAQLGKVYNSRSLVVHGGSVDPLKLYEHKEEAIRVAVESLRRLFADHPDLIAVKDRGHRLILDC